MALDKDIFMFCRRVAESGGRILEMTLDRAAFDRLSRDLQMNLEESVDTDTIDVNINFPRGRTIVRRSTV